MAKLLLVLVALKQQEVSQLKQASKDHHHWHSDLGSQSFLVTLGTEPPYVGLLGGWLAVGLLGLKRSGWYLDDDGHLPDECLDV